MSKLNEGENPCPYMGTIIPNEKGEIEIPDDSYKIAVGPVDVKNNLLTLSKVDKYSYKKSGDKVYRIGDKGIEYPSMSIEKFEKLQQLHEEYFGKEQDDDDINR